MPGGLFASLAAVLVVALVAQFAASTVLFERAELVSADDADVDRAADALATAARVLEATAAAERPAAARALSRPRFAVAWPAEREAIADSSARAAARGGAASEGLASEAAPAADDGFAERLVVAAPALAGRALTVRLPGGVDDIRGTARLDDGSVLAFSLPRPTDPIPAFIGTLASAAILSAFVLLAALTVARSLAAPLRALVDAADAIGTGPAVPVAADGPRETRRLAEAFNAMQRRIDRLISDRTQALAAVTHDLRTPISRMQLRCGLIPEGEDRDAFVGDLGEMEGMIASLAAYLRGEADPEAPRRLDLAAMLQTLVDDAADAGRRASYNGPGRHVMTLRPLATKRALANVVNNALTHGGSAAVTLAPGSPTLVSVEDDGPGVPPDQLEKVFEPFHRVDPARSTGGAGGAGGMGLGLSIARQAVGREGGTIALANRAGGGLRVTIAYPGV